MGCEDIRDLLALYAGGETHENERIAVEAHVGLCAACARELDQYREMRATLGSLREGDVPTGIWKGIWQGVRESLFPRRASRALGWFDAVLRHAAVLMVGVAIGVGAYYVQRDFGGAPSAKAPLPATNTEGTVLVSNPSGLAGGLATDASTFRLELIPPTRPFVPQARPEGNAYLPRVESVQVDGDKDF